MQGKEIKRATLNEIVDYITAGRGVLTEAVYGDIIRMVSYYTFANWPKFFRSLRRISLASIVIPHVGCLVKTAFMYQNTLLFNCLW